MRGSGGSGRQPLASPALLLGQTLVHIHKYKYKYKHKYLLTLKPLAPPVLLLGQTLLAQAQPADRDEDEDHLGKDHHIESTFWMLIIDIYDRFMVGDLSR